MVLIKCCDISNEVRPMEVAEPWVDCLLEEYFMQVRMRERCDCTNCCSSWIPPQLQVLCCLTAQSSSRMERILLQKVGEGYQQEKLFRKQVNAIDCNFQMKDNSNLEILMLADWSLFSVKWLPCKFVWCVNALGAKRARVLARESCQVNYIKYHLGTSLDNFHCMWTFP